MSQYELDVQFAKDIITLVESAQAGLYEYKDNYIITENAHGTTRITISGYVESFDYSYDRLFVNNMLLGTSIDCQIDNTIYKFFDDDFIGEEENTVSLMTNPEDEAFYFQNSLLYTEHQNTGLLVCSYLCKHFYGTDIKSISFNLDDRLSKMIADTKKLLKEK